MFLVLMESFPFTFYILSKECNINNFKHDVAILNVLPLLQCMQLCSISYSIIDE